MGQAARRSAARFSRQAFIESWRAIFAEVEPFAQPL
jgi:hypothetical protein